MAVLIRELSPNRESFLFGVFVLDLKTRELRRNGSKVKLQEQSFKLLQLLLENAGKIVSREEIIRLLWPAVTVDYPESIRVAVKKVRKALGDNAKKPIYIETAPGQGFRFVYPVEPWPEPPPTPATPPPVRPRKNRLRAVLLWVAVAVLSGAVYFGVAWWHGHRLTAQDTVVLAEFNNTTGDPAFDDALRQGLRAQLEQSPFLNLLPDERIAEVLSLMGQPNDTRLTVPLARQVCERTASSALIEGSIGLLGSEYVLGLRAADCPSGRTLVEVQETAAGKEQVLIKALSRAATRVRQKLGESPASVEKYDKPPEDVTTPSLEALKAYSIGYRAQVVTGDPAAATAAFERAISLDPQFAMAYARLGMNFANLGETARAHQNTRKAYELRERASERERFYISSHYEQYVSGDLDAAREAYELWAATYPGDATPPNNLAVIYFALGKYGKALAACQETVRLDSGSRSARANLVSAYQALNRLDKAKATALEAQARHLDSPFLHAYLYFIDFQRNDAAGCTQEASALKGTAGYEDWALEIESNTAAFAGRFAEARDFTRSAAEAARRADEKETAAGYLAEAAVREALVGNRALARQQARSVVALSRGKDLEDTVAVALALAGDSAGARRLAEDLAGRFPKDTIVQSQYLPVIRAAGIMGARPRNAAQAIEALKTAEPFELGSDPTVSLQVYAPYLRGEAYLELQQGAEAAAEFRKILDHPGIVGNELIGALAHLGLGRAWALSGDTVKARSSYQNFLALWKDADPDIPLLRVAKTEFAKLH